MTEQYNLSSGNRRDSRELLVDKSTQTDAQKAVAISFVTHSGGIIALNCLMTYNFIIPFWGNFIKKLTLFSFYCQIPEQEYFYGKNIYQLQT